MKAFPDFVILFKGMPALKFEQNLTFMAIKKKTVQPLVAFACFECPAHYKFW